MAEPVKVLAPAPELVDQRVYLHGVSWEDYERLLEVRGDDPRVRMTYLEGVLEIMSPSRTHERLKTRLARLLEAWSEEMGADLEGVGSWPIRQKTVERGLEPDESYFVGAFDEEAEAPHLAIEVVWTGGGIDKLTVYAGLGVREVWIWEEGRLSFHALRQNAYHCVPRSEVLPELDPELIGRLMEADCTQAQAVRDLRAVLRSGRAKPK
jgi:Uma2 family endonuclease